MSSKTAPSGQSFSGNSVGIEMSEQGQKEKRKKAPQRQVEQTGRKRWKNEMKHYWWDFAWLLQEYPTDEQIVFNSQCGCVMRFVWTIIWTYLVLYIVVIAQGYRRELMPIAAPVASINSDYIYFMGNDRINSQSFWVDEKQPSQDWCRAKPFYIPRVLPGNEHYHHYSAMPKLTREAPFSAWASCLNPIISAGFIETTASPVLQVPTAVVSLMSQHSDLYSHEPFEPTLTVLEIAEIADRAAKAAAEEDARNPLVTERPMTNAEKQAASLAEMSPEEMAAKLAAMSNQAAVLAAMSPAALELAKAAMAGTSTEDLEKALATITALIAMPPDELAASLKAMSPEEQKVVLSHMSPEDRAATLAAMSNTDRLAALVAMSPEDRAATLAAMSNVDRLAAWPTMSPAVRAATLAEMSAEDQYPVLVAMPPEDRAATLAEMSVEDQEIFAKKMAETDETSTLFQDSSRIYFLTGVDFTMLSVDFYVANREGIAMPAESYQDWNPSFTTRLLDSEGAIVKGCPAFPTDSDDTDDQNSENDCVWSSSRPYGTATSGPYTGGRVTMQLHNILQAAGVDINSDNPLFSEHVKGMQDDGGDADDPLLPNVLDPEPPYPYRLTGVTLLMNIETANYCAGSKTYLEAGSAYDVMTQFHPECLALAMPLFQDPPAMQANITVTKIDDYGVLKNLLDAQEAGSPFYEYHTGVKIIVQVNGNLVETTNVFIIGSRMVPMLVLLLVIFQIGIFCTNCCVTFSVPHYCHCGYTGPCSRLRSVSCCKSDSLYWNSLKEETGRDIDPHGMRYWTKKHQNVFDQAAKMNNTDQQFRKVNPEPMWKTSLRNNNTMQWQDYGVNEHPCDLTDITDGEKYLAKLRGDHDQLVTKDIGADQLQIVEKWLFDVNSRQSKEKMLKINKQKQIMAYRLNAKREALQMLLNPAGLNQNLLRLIILEMYHAMKPLLQRSLRNRTVGKVSEMRAGMKLGQKPELFEL